MQPIFHMGYSPKDLLLLKLGCPWMCSMADCDTQEGSQAHTVHQMTPINCDEAVRKALKLKNTFQTLFT